MTLLSLLDQLEEMIDSAPEIPFTGRAVIDGDQALELLARIREALPEEYRTGAQGEAAAADDAAVPPPTEAERIIMEAEAYANRLVSEHEVTQRAEEEAQRILEKARQQARELELEAEQYALSVLERLESSLERTLQVVQRGKEELTSSEEVSPSSSSHASTS